MKTFTKALIAAGVGLFGVCGAATAATPYGSTSSTYGIAAGGCYVPAASNCYDTAYDHRYGDPYGSSYRPTSTYDHAAWRPLPFRSVYDARDDYHTLPYPTSRDDAFRRNTNWSECSYNSPSRLPTKPYLPSSQFQNRYDSVNHRYEDRYDRSPLFEPWRPLNASDAGRTKW